MVVSNLAPDLTLTDLVGAEHLPAELIARLSGRDHRAAFVQIHFALDGLPQFAPPYELLNEPGMQQSIGIFGSPEEQQRQWEREPAACYRTIHRWVCRFRHALTQAWRRRASMPQVHLPMLSPSKPTVINTGV